MVRKITALLALAMYLLALICFQSHRENATHVILTSAVDPKIVEDIQRWEQDEEMPIGFCFWGETPGRVECRQIGSGAEVSVVSLAGNPELFMAPGLAWREGCYVDPETARKLFGTAQCAGQKLWLEDRVYPVLGTLESPIPQMVCIAREWETLDRLILAVPPDCGAVLAPGRLLKWGLRGSVLYLDGFQSLAQNCLLLLPMALMISACGHLWRQARWKRLLGLCLGLGCLYLLGHLVWIPARFFPTQWSDFSFWGKLVQRERENLLQLLRMPMGGGQLQMLGSMVQSIGTSTAAWLLWIKRGSANADTADRGRREPAGLCGFLAGKTGLCSGCKPRWGRGTVLDPSADSRCGTSGSDASGNGWPGGAAASTAGGNRSAGDLSDSSGTDRG